MNNSVKPIESGINDIEMTLETLLTLIKLVKKPLGIKCRAAFSIAGYPALLFLIRSRCRIRI